VALPVILATQEAEIRIRRIVVWSQPRKIVCMTQSQKIGMVEFLKV
jgi:hypothetical protein